MIKKEKEYIIEETIPDLKIKRTSKTLTQKQFKQLKKILSIVLVLVLMTSWALIAYKGIEMGKLYIDDAMTNLEAKNTANYQALLVENAALNLEIKNLNAEIDLFKSDVTSLNEAIDLFSLEVVALKASIDFIDTSVTASITIQEDIGNKIQSLDLKIQALKKSLNILMEAP